MPLPVAKNIDVAGARALFDALGFEEAVAFVRCLSIWGCQFLPCLRLGGPYAAPGRTSPNGAHVASTPTGRCWRSPARSDGK